jgi:ribosomal protein L16 Arg81 hydroxylase
MGSAIADFASLLHPLSSGSFFADYWERQPLVIRRSDIAYYQGLMTEGDLEDFISNPNTRFPAIKLAKDGWFYPPEAYTADVEIGMCLFTGVTDLKKISEEYSKGASITLPALHQTWRPLKAFCTRVEHELDHSIHANAYITPGRAAGFPPHYDTHEVLVMQLAGKKRWQINEPTIKLPHSDQQFKPEGFVPGPRLMEIELQAGDLLYLPRGYVHSTTTSEWHSVHVTLGVNVYTWVDVVRESVPSAVDSEELRKALPPGFASRPELRPVITEQLKRILAGLSAGNDGERLFDQFVYQILSARQRAYPPFRADVTVISPDLLLQTPSQQRYNLAPGVADHVVLNFDGRTYGFPGTVAPTLTAMCDRPRFRLQDLPDRLDSQLLLSLARYLQGIGFLRPVA